jgi:hypothetical protein
MKMSNPNEIGSDIDFSVLPPYTTNLVGSFNLSKRAGDTSGYIRPLGIGSSFNKTAVISPFIPHVQVMNGKFVAGEYALGY